jgi:hypothetical protein
MAFGARSDLEMPGGDDFFHLFALSRFVVYRRSAGLEIVVRGTTAI